MYFNWFPLLKTSTIEVGVVGEFRSDERFWWWWFYLSLSRPRTKFEEGHFPLSGLDRP